MYEQFTLCTKFELNFILKLSKIINYIYMLISLHKILTFLKLYKKYSNIYKIYFK
jgi:hypothetical protein